MCRSWLYTLVMAPNADAVGVRFGPFITGWFNALKNSQRYWRLKRSWMRVFLMMEASTLFVAGRRRAGKRDGNVRIWLAICCVETRLNASTLKARSGLFGAQLIRPPR